MLQGISDIHPILKRKRAVYWRRIDSRKVFIRSFVRSYYQRPFYSFILLILQLDSSSSEQLLKSMESCKTQTKRSKHLQTQCALLNEKVHNLMQKLTEKSAVQRDSALFSFSGTCTVQLTQAQTILSRGDIQSRQSIVKHDWKLFFIGQQ